MTVIFYNTIEGYQVDYVWPCASVRECCTPQRAGRLPHVLP